ncbi:MAG: UDP binding domain-containing protein, partial [Bacillota bacterium]
NCDLQMVQAALEVNYRQKVRVIEKLQGMLKVIRGSTVGVLGLAFKPNTDDIRESPAIEVIRMLLDMGARVKVYDPVAENKYRQTFPDQDVVYCRTVEEAARDSDALVILTDWEEFSHLPWSEIGSLMNRQVLVDGRNMLDAEELAGCGFKYSGIGR